MKYFWILILMPVAVSCVVDDGRWDFYDVDRNDYSSYANDIMKNCIRKPVMVLDYAKQVKKAAGTPEGGATYRIPDGNGGYVGTIKCVQTAPDTLWRYDNELYAISEKDGRWVISQTYDKDDDMWYYGFRYEYEIEAIIEEDAEEDALRNTWSITLTGTRDELSEYSLSYRISDPMRIVPEKNFAQYTGEILPYGVMELSFMRGSVALDWLHVTYEGQKTSCTSSFGGD